MKYIKNIVVVVILSGVVLFTSCKKEENKIPTQADVINEWIWMVMNEIYYWAADINQSLYPTDHTDPESFFYSILSNEDQFSWIVDDYEELVNSFNNIELSTGMSPYFIRKTGTEDVIAAIEYVSAGSPADSAGIKRGDIISKINGLTMNTSNYSALFYGEKITAGFSDFVDGELIPNDREVSITARVIEQNPIVHHEVIDYQNTKIGYLVYTAFSAGEGLKWRDSIDNVLLNFQDQGISELIMDLRYNPGGLVSMANYIASSVAPASVPGNGNVFVTYVWNDLYNEYWSTNEGDESENLVVKFTEANILNLNLENIYFLTSGHTASASELIMIGLDPYMQVYRIGEKTYGKSFGSITIPDTQDPPRHSWAMQPIVFQYSNSYGITGFIDGLDPDIAVFDNMLQAKPFGDYSDPILAVALEQVTGVSPLTKKATDFDPMPQYRPLADPVREFKNRAVLDMDR